MTSSIADPTHLDDVTLRFYRDVLERMRRSGPPFLVGGAYAFACYTGIVRHTKDLDLFVRPADAGAALETLAAAGCRTEIAFNHWLGKAFREEDFVDIIYSSGNGLCPVDDAWFGHAVAHPVLGRPASLCPPEEMIWQKAFIQERERFDGADVAHLIHARGRTLDWRRLLDRFGSHGRVLFGHLVLFSYIYPAARDRIPGWVLDELTARWRAEESAPPPEGPECRGVLLSRMQYLSDLERGGGRDPRLPPSGSLSAEEVKAWTDAAFAH